MIQLDREVREDDVGAEVRDGMMALSATVNGLRTVGVRSRTENV